VSSYARLQLSALLDGRFAARCAQMVDGQQRRNPRPGHIGRFTINVSFKETIQIKPLPQVQSKKTGAEHARSLQVHFVQQHPRCLRIVIGWRHMRGEQFQLLRIDLLVEYLKLKKLLRFWEVESERWIDAQTQQTP